MPDYLRHGLYLVIAVQHGEVLAICATDCRQTADARAAWERRTNKRLGGVHYAAGFWRQQPDGSWQNDAEGGAK
jgi:hypothetical protein